MKKNYIAPNVEITEIELQQMIAESGKGVSSSGQGIGWGGEDDGTHEGGARRRRRKDVWDEEEEDDFGY